MLYQRAYSLDLLDIALVNSSELAIAIKLSKLALLIMSADLALCATAQSACVVSGKWC